jgi:hypothetical protein
MELEQFPTELIKIVISFLDVDAKLVVRVINKRWFKLIDERDFVTFMVSKAQVEDVVETFSRCQKPIYLSFLKNKFRSLADISNHITKLTNLTGLEIEILREPATISDWINLSVLTDLQYLKILLNSDTIPLDLYGHLKGLTSIEGFNTKDPCHFSVLQNLSNLESLEFNCKKVFNPFTIIPCPGKLTKLTAIGRNFKWYEADLDRWLNLKDLIYDEMDSAQLFPVSKLTNLESLGITAMEIDEYPDNLTSLSVEGVSLRHMTKLTNLEFLRINFSQIWPDNEKKELFSYIKSLGLKELIVNQLDVKGGSECFKELMKLAKLEFLTLDIDRGEVDGKILSVVINSLTNLVNLEINSSSRKKTFSLEISAAMTKLAEINLSGASMEFENVSAMTALRTVSPTFAKFRQFQCLAPCLENLLGIPGNTPFTRVLTDMQHLTSMSVTGVSTERLYGAIGKLTNLESLKALSVEQSLNFEMWTDLRKLTWLDLYVNSPAPLDKLTLLTSLQVLTMNIDSTQFKFDKDALFDKLPNLYDVTLL